MKTETRGLKGPNQEIYGFLWADRVLRLRKYTSHKQHFLDFASPFRTLPPYHLAPDCILAPWILAQVNASGKQL
jgi:hypothetical protein